jgi:hypothetical protein
MTHADTRAEIDPQPVLRIDRAALARTVRRAADEAATEYMRRVAPDLPPIDWDYDDRCRHPAQLRGRISDFDHVDPATVAEQWRVALGLGSEFRDCGDGTVECDGTIESGPVLLWYIADRDRWEADLERWRQEWARRKAMAITTEGAK